MDRRTFLTMTLAVSAYVRQAQASLQNSGGGVPWTQWGGPHRNFQTEATGLKDTWPSSGPRVVWKRALGEGTHRRRSRTASCTRRMGSRRRRW